MKKLKLSLSSQSLIWVLSLYFGTILNLTFYHFIAQRLEISNFSTVLFVFSLPVFVIVPLLILFSLITIPYFGKTLTIILLCLSSITNYAMFKLGIFIDSDMYRNIVETTAREATDLITPTAVIWFAITGVLPAVLLFCCHIKYLSAGKEIIRRLKHILCSLLLLLCLMPFTYKDYVSFGRNNKQIKKLMNTFNYIYSVGRYYQRQAIANRQFVILDENPIREDIKENQPRVLILIVGETARAANFSIYGYERQTTPLLQEQNVIAFKDTLSCGTSTAVSLPCMFSHMTRKKFDVVDAKYTQNLIDLLAKSGYDILWRENDDGCKEVCNRVATEDMLRIHNKKFCHKKYCQDEALLDGLEQKIAAVTKDTVIVLHMMGSHGPTYYKRYPDEFRKFLPTCDTADLQNCTREEIVNTYDNTILYTDFIIDSAIDVLKKFPQYASGLIYISDHGESLGENSLYLHGIPYSVAPDVQKEIPFIFWMSDNLSQRSTMDKFCLYQEAEKGNFSHDNLFHSVLGLLNIKTTTYEKDLDIFERCRFTVQPALGANEQ